MSAMQMPAVVVREGAKKGAWNELDLDRVPMPSLSEGDVLVQVEACSVNRADLLQRRGFYPPPPGASDVLGLDFAGTVTDIGPDVSGWNPGDRVFGITAGGGYGRYASVPADSLVLIPENLSFTEAAAAAEVFFTAYYNLFVLAAMKAGETLLLHGAGSGVGTAAIQLVSAIGASSIVTAGSRDKIEGALRLGAAAGIVYKEEDFAGRVREITDGKGVDVVLDWIGGAYLKKHLDILKSRGRLVIIGLMGGTTAEINLAQVVSKRLRIIGSVLRTQSRAEKAVITKGFIETVHPLLRSGRVKPIIDRVFPIEDVEKAHLYLKGGEHFGKAVLTWESFKG
ncbi:MAG: NAD(P)H-quinone oxidoreductase [Desulfobacteraceae bacterium]|nr:NAD(P)H-quinone oxidoreductase [Desulfobacteraceae bacterium]